mgnify:FL=1
MQGGSRVDILKVGKLDSDILEKIVFGNIRYKSADVIKRAGLGEDCAVMDFGDYDCVVSTDPITATPNEIGKLAVYISCNDIASNGIEPFALTMSVLLPEGTTEEEVELIMKQAGEAAMDLEVEIVGGHTEITTAVVRPVIVSTVFGKSLRGESQTCDLMEAGDLICVTKDLALEGTAIVVSDHEDTMSEVLSEDEIKKAKSFMDMISVVKDGVLAGSIGTHGMHDVTEGGILGAVWEMCMNSKLGARLHENRIPLTDITKKVMKYLDVDPLKMISSGSMVMAISKDKEEDMKAAFKDAGINFSVIGEIVNEGEGITLESADGISPVLPPQSDEIYSALSKLENMKKL